MFKKLLILVVCSAVLVVAGTGLWAWQGLQTLKAPVALTEPLLFKVPHGASFSATARRMEGEGLVSDSLWLRLYGRVVPDQARIRAGEYEFQPGMSALDMVAAMVRGDVKQWQVRIIEGWTFQDMREALARSEHLAHETRDWTDAEIMKAVGAEGDHPEGRFFPDTYLYTGGDTDLDVLKRAHQRMTDVLSEEWQNRAKDLPYDTPYEALIMASIVERETGVPEERNEVAGVFVRRLQKGMRLQTDPTVIYGMGDDYQGGITLRDLKTYTPYNTYRINGLPPTPIALPGEGAIHAALHPDDGNALYFVARGDGTHQFSATLQAHQKAVRRFQLNRRDDYRSAPPPETTSNNTENSGETTP